MLIANLSTSQASNDAPVQLKCTGYAGDISARIYRSATLDGGAVISHMGANRIDQPIDLVCPQLTRGDAASIAAIMETTTEQTLAVESVLYVGVIERFVPARGKIRFQVSEAIVYG